MTEEAKLVLSVDARQPAAAAKTLDDLAGAGKRAEESVGKVGAASVTAERGLSSVARTAMLATTAVTAAAGAVALMTKHAIDAADAMNDLHLRTGLAFKDLAAYDQLTRQSGATTEELTGAIKHLSKYMVEHGDKLRSIGVTSKDSSLAMRQFADVVASIKDPALRSALAQEVLSRSGDKLIPTLIGGSAAFNDSAISTAEYGAMLEKVAPQADNFNDKLSVMSTMAKTAGLKLADYFLPALNDIADEFLRVEKTSGAFMAALYAGGYAGARMLGIESVKEAVAASNEVTWTVVENAGKTEAAVRALVAGTKEHDAALKALKKTQDEVEHARQRYMNGVGTETEAVLAEVKAAELENEQFGKTRTELAALEQARIDEAVTTKIAAAAALDGVKGREAELYLIRQQIKALLDLKALKTGKEALEASAEQRKIDEDAAKKAIAEQTAAHKEMWNIIESTAHTTWNEVWKGGRDAFTNIGKTLKSAVLDLLYQMTLKKWILSIGMSAAGGAAGAAGMDGNGASGASGDWMNIGKSIYDSVSGGFAAIGQGVTNAVYQAGVQAGSTTVMQASSYAGAAASYFAGGMAGIAIGSALAGDKKIGGISGSDASTAGAVIGAIVGGPVGAAIGGTIGGAAVAAFGMGPKTSGQTNLVGNFTGAGFAGQYQTPWTSKGGWFRDNAGGIDTTSISERQGKQFSNTVMGTKLSFDALLAASGNAIKSIDGWSYSVNAAATTQEQMKAVVDGMAQSMGNLLIPQLVQFQQEGENLAATALRMTEVFVVTDSIVKLVGQDTATAFARVGLESMNARDNLIGLLGGVVAANSTMQGFFSNYYTSAQQQSVNLAALDAQFRALGVSTPATRDQFRALVGSQNLSTAAGQKQFASLMALSGAFAAVTKSSDELIKSLQDKANADVANYMKAVDGMRQFAKTVRELMSSLLLSTDSPLSGARKNALALANFSAVNARAAGGDSSAMNALSGAAGGYLTGAREQSRTAADYARSFAFVQGSLDQTAMLVGNQVTAADAQLEELKKANAWLTALNDKSTTQIGSLSDLGTVAVASAQAANDAVKASEPVILNTKTTADVLLDINSGKSAGSTATSSGSLGASGGGSSVGMGTLLGAGLGYAVGGPIGGAIGGFIGSLFSFDGGGYTGNGARSGGVDGMGGFAAILHPNETVIDHTKMRSGGSGSGMSDSLLKDLLDEVRALRAENQSGQVAVATNTGKAAKLLDRWNGEGMPPVRV